MGIGDQAVAIFNFINFDVIRDNTYALYAARATIPCIPSAGPIGFNLTRWSMTRIDLPPTDPVHVLRIRARECSWIVPYRSLSHSYKHAWQISGNYFSHAGRVIVISRMYMMIMSLLRKYWRLRVCGK